MSQLNGSEKAAAIRMFDAAITRMQPGESAAVLVRIGPAWDRENALAVTVRDQHHALHQSFPAHEVAKWSPSVMWDKLNQQFDALRTMTRLKNTLGGGEVGERTPK